MFGFFESDVKKVRRLRTQFEDIRQRVLFKMNHYEQMSFATIFEEVPEVVSEFERIHPSDAASWKKLGDELMQAAQQSYRMHSRGSELTVEGGRAGSEGLAVMAIEAYSKSYQIAEAVVLQQDIAKFKKATYEFLLNPENRGYLLPKDL